MPGWEAGDHNDHYENTPGASRAFLSLAQFSILKKRLYKLCNKFFDEHVLLVGGMQFQPQVY